VGTDEVSFDAEAHCLVVLDTHSNVGLSVVVEARLPEMIRLRPQLILIAVPALPARLGSPKARVSSEGFLFARLVS